MLRASIAALGAALIATTAIATDLTYTGDARVVTNSNGDVVILMAETNNGNSNADHFVVFAPSSPSYSGIDSTVTGATLVVAEDASRCRLYNSSQTLLVDVTTGGSIGSPTLIGYTGGNALTRTDYPDVCALNVSGTSQFTAIWAAADGDCQSGGIGSTSCGVTCTNTGGCNTSCGSGYYACCRCRVLAAPTCKCKAN